MGKIRDVLREFFNESSRYAYEDSFVPHAGNDNNCGLCKIEKKFINKLQSLSTFDKQKEHNSGFKKSAKNNKK